MALGMSSALATGLFAGTTSVDDYAYVQLHKTGEPGAAGTSNVATESDRVLMTYATAASGASSNSAALEWLSVAGTEDYLYFSMWTLSSAGSFGYSGSVTSNPVTAGDTFTIPANDLDCSFPLAS